MAEILSFSGFVYPVVREACFFAILILTLVLSLQKLEYGLLILLGELFIGSKGYLFYFEQGGLAVSIRIALFLAVLSVWLAKMIVFWAKQDWRAAADKLKLPYWQYYALLGAAVIWGGVNGYWQGNEFSNIFFDANSWLYWLIILPLSFVINEHGAEINKFWGKIAAIFSASVAWIITETLLLLFFFSHNFGAAAAQAVYKWVRVTGVGEITFTPLGFYRIFIQSQLYILVGLFIFISLLLYLQLVNKRSLLIYYFISLLGGMAVILASFSRSFWLGAVVGLLCFYALIFLRFYKEWRTVIWNMALTLSAAALAVGLIFLLVRFPYPESIANFSPELLAQRALVAEAGVSSRWNLLPPLLREIKQAPIFGKGFGATVTYKTQDPRILEQNPTGEYTTYAFEWGYLDIWLKLGLLGLVVYLILLGKIIVAGIKIIKNYELSITNLMTVGLLSGLVMVMVTSFFSPYLNHPLGIGYVVLISLFIEKNKKPRFLS